MTGARNPEEVGKAWGKDLETFLALSKGVAVREDIELPAFRKKMIEGQHVRVDEVGDMQIVADAGPVRRGIVGPEYLQSAAKAQGALHRNLH